MHYVMGLLSAVDGCTWSLVAECLIYLVSVCRECKPSKDMMAVVLSTLSSSIDSACGVVANCNLTADPSKIFHPRGIKRCQRLDETLVKHFVETMVKEGVHPSAARAARALQTLPERTARQQEETYVLKYMLTTSQCFQDACQISVVCDDVRVSGEKCQISTVFSNQIGKAAWLVPQVI
jgi:hypothetical protein